MLGLAVFRCGCSRGVLRSVAGCRVGNVSSRGSCLSRFHLVKRGCGCGIVLLVDGVR